MTADVIIVSSNMTVLEAERLLEQCKFERLPGGGQREAGGLGHRGQSYPAFSRLSTALVTAHLDRKTFLLKSVNLIEPQFRVSVLRIRNPA